jgi:agmatine deiminase
MSRPAEDGFFMPGEWAPHRRCWMAWPCRESLWGDAIDEARDAYAEVAKAIAEFEPVTMIANPENVARGRRPRRDCRDRLAVQRLGRQVR